jgi:hypothetical protein
MKAERLRKMSFGSEAADVTASHPESGRASTIPQHCNGVKSLCRAYKVESFDPEIWPLHTIAAVQLLSPNNANGVITSVASENTKNMHLFFINTPRNDSFL